MQDVFQVISAIFYGFVRSIKTPQIFLLAMTYSSTLVCCLTSTRLRGVTMELGSLVGSMSQPSSSYYHFVSGGYVTLASNEDRLLLRAQHWERPVFSAVGYLDQDIGDSITIGSKLSASSPESHGIYSFLGWSKISGYIKSTGKRNTTEQRRGYVLEGPTFAFFYRIPINIFTVSLGHQLSVVLSHDIPTSARVAWPFSFVWLSIGAVW